MENLAKININPTGINWDEEDVVVSSANGVKRNTKGGTISSTASEGQTNAFYASLSDNYIKVASAYYATGTEVKVIDNKYISIRQVKDVMSVLNNVKNVTAAIENHNKILVDVGETLKAIDSSKWNEYPKIRRQVRVYKDRKIACVNELEWKDGSKNYYVFNPQTVKKYYSQNNRWYSSLMKAGDLGELTTAADEKEREEILKSAGMLEVKTDEEIEASALESGGEKRWSLQSYIQISGGNLKENNKGNNVANRNGEGNYGSSDKWDEKTIKEVNNFFDLFDEEQKDLKEEFDRRWTYIGYSYNGRREVKEGITSLSFLGKLLSIKSSTIKTKKTNDNYIATIWPTIHWDDKKVIWERRGDLVICSQKKSVYDDMYHKTAFIYNVKTKIRKVLTQYGSSEVTMAIPSLSTGILGNFDLEQDRKWDSKKQKYIYGKYPEEEIIGAASFRELFDGTNVAWILDNTKTIDSKFKIVKSPGNSYNSAKQICKLTEEISESRMGTVAIQILATTGDPLLEQLLKNKQFNLYFMAIYSKAQKEDLFTDIDKKGKDLYGTINYHGKEKSLKKMLGMTMQQIQILNETVKIEPKFFSYSVPKIAGSDISLGITGYTAITPDMFEKILKLSSNGSCYNTWRYIRCDYRPNLKEVLDRMNTKVRLDFLNKLVGEESSGGSTEIYEDYLSMRKQLKELQALYPDKEIFDGKAYPEKPGEARRFIEFIQGMRDMRYSWAEYYINTDQEFKCYIESRYREENKNNINFVKVNDKITGAVVEFDMFSNIKYLHDDVTVWFNLFKDEAEAEKFKVALERVKPLEWEDDTGDLCMIAPKNPSDVRNEGHILSHCVASFVGPIISGDRNVMFIRRKDMKEEPFYTIDISPEGKIRQIHCYMNGNTSQEDINTAYKKTQREVYNTKTNVLSFVRKWAKAQNGKIDSSSIRATYGCLAA